MKAFEMSSFHVYFLYFRPDSYSMLKGCVHHSRYIFLTYVLFPFKAQRYIIVLNLKSSWILKSANPPRIILDDTQLDPRVEAITYLKWDCYPQVDFFRPPQRTTSETAVTPTSLSQDWLVVQTFWFLPLLKPEAHVSFLQSKLGVNGLIKSPLSASYHHFLVFGDQKLNLAYLSS